MKCHECGLHTAKLYYCGNQCGTIYCGSECQSQSWNTWHSSLCPIGGNGETDFVQVLKAVGRNEVALRQILSFWGISREEVIDLSLVNTAFRDLISNNNFFWYVLAKHYDLINEHEPYNFNVNYRVFIMPIIPKKPLKGIVYGFGFGELGRLGDDRTTWHEIGIPTIISNLQDIAQVSTGFQHSLFLTRNGMVYGCGEGANGRLGLGELAWHEVAIPTIIPNLQDIAQVSAGNEHSLFLTRDGRVYVCGTGYLGLLGDGITDWHNVYIPILLSNLHNVVQISAGRTHSLFLMRDGSVYGCGTGLSGQLGLPSSVSIPTVIPNLQDIIQVSAGKGLYSLFLTRNGMVYACGDGEYGKLGDGIIEQHKVFIVTIIPNLHDIAQVSAGFDHSLFLTRNGMVYVCGDGEFGQLGDGITDDDHSVGIPTIIPNLQDIAQVSSGKLYSLFLTRNGMVYACGDGEHGKLGDDDVIPHSISNPTKILKIQGIAQVSAGAEHSLCLTII